MHIIFVRSIFGLAMLSENILITKISGFTVVVGGRWREGGADVQLK